MSFLEALRLCGSFAAGLTLIGVILTPREKHFAVLFRSWATRPHMNAMEEDGIERYCLIWYHGGAPLWAWVRLGEEN